MTKREKTFPLDGGRLGWGDLSTAMPVVDDHSVFLTAFRPLASTRATIKTSVMPDLIQVIRRLDRRIHAGWKDGLGRKAV
jgi:hypothetical protein